VKLRYHEAAEEELLDEITRALIKCASLLMRRRRIAPPVSHQEAA